MSIVSDLVYLDWYISPLAVGVNVILRGDVVYHRNRAFTDLDPTESIEHSEHRIMSTIRELVARIDAGLLRSAQVRILYAGDLQYAEPYHKTTRFDTPTQVDMHIQQQSMDAHIRDISERSVLSLFSHKKLTEFRVYNYTAKGFPYVNGSEVSEYTVHGFVGWVNGSFHLKIERLLYLSGCLNQSILVSSFSAYIPRVIDTVLPKGLPMGSILVYEFGMHSVNLYSVHRGLPESSVRIHYGYADLSRADCIQEITEQTLSLCLAPSGVLEAIVVVPDEYMQYVRPVMQKILETALYVHPGYRFGAGYMSIQLESDMQSMFQQCFPAL